MLPNVSAALDRWAEPYVVKTITKASLDFVITQSVTARTIQAVVQPAQKDKLKSDKIDWSLAYFTVHTSSTLENGELIVIGGEDYKIIDNGNYQAYGFTEALAEQTKKAVVS